MFISFAVKSMRLSTPSRLPSSIFLLKCQHWLLFPTTTGKKYLHVHDANQTSCTYNTQESYVVFTSISLLLHSVLLKNDPALFCQKISFYVTSSHSLCCPSVAYVSALWQTCELHIERQGKFCICTHLTSFKKQWWIVTKFPANYSVSPSIP